MVNPQHNNITMLSDSQKSNRIHKILSGRADTNTNKRLHEEPKSSFYVPNSNVWSDSADIPALAPNHLANGEIEGVVQYIADLVLEAIPGSPQAYRHENLKKCIPEFFGTGYVPVLKDSIDNVLPYMFGDFQIDNYAGILRFYTAALSAPPKISFYRYVGKTGLISTEKEEDVSRVIYVRGFGDDSTGNGDEATPFRTLEKALSTVQKRINASVSIEINLGDGDFIMNRKCIDYFNAFYGEGMIYVRGMQPEIIYDNVTGTEKEISVYNGEKIAEQSTVKVGILENVNIDGVPAEFINNENVGLLYHNGSGYSYVTANTADTITYNGCNGVGGGYICQIMTTIHITDPTFDFGTGGEIRLKPKHWYTSFEFIGWDVHGHNVGFYMYMDMSANIFYNGTINFKGEGAIPMALYDVFAPSAVALCSLKGNLTLDNCYMNNVESVGCDYVANSEFGSIQGKFAFYPDTVIKFSGNPSHAVYESTGLDIDLRDSIVVFKEKSYALALDANTEYKRNQNKMLISRYAVLDNCLQPNPFLQGAVRYSGNIMVQGRTFAHEKETINVRLPIHTEETPLKVPIGWYINDDAKNDKMIVELKLMENTDKNRFYESTLKVVVLQADQHFTEDYVSSEEIATPFPLTLDIIREDGIIYLTLLATAHATITDIIGAVHVHDRITIDTYYN